MKYYFINIRNKTEFMNIAKNVVQRYLQEYYGISSNYMSLPDRIEQYGNSRFQDESSPQRPCNNRVGFVRKNDAGGSVCPDVTVRAGQ